MLGFFPGSRMFNVDALPSFPVSGPLRWLAISSTVSFVLFALAGVVQRRKGDRNEALWATAPAVLVLVGLVLGRVIPPVHPVATAATFAVALRNIWVFSGLPRWLEIGGAASWVVAILAARALFS